MNSAKHCSPAWERTITMLWYFPLIHIGLPRCLPVPAYQVHVPLPLRWIGHLVTVFGTVLTTWSMYHLVHHGQGTPAPFDPPTQLVQSGPYQYCRNPMELGNLLTLLGRTLSSGSLRLLLTSLVFGLCHHLWFLWVEEPGLQHRFGHQYHMYQQSVPRWCRHELTGFHNIL